MKRYFVSTLFIRIFFVFFSTALFAGNPFVTHIYTADPSAHVFENRVYVYSSHDKDNAGWFDMEDYHVFSSVDLINWVDHGAVFSYKSLTPDGSGNYGWIGGPDPAGESSDPKWNVQYMHPRLWAPDCVYKNGTYYLYYPARDKTVPSVKTGDNWPRDQFKIGVATSKTPYGPFVPAAYNGIQSYIPGSFSIDPCVFIDQVSNQAYMAFGGLAYGGLTAGDGPYIVKLKDNMIEFDGVPQLITNNGTPLSDWFEGCWIHQRRDAAGKMWYYLSYPNDMHITGMSELHYAMNDDITNNNGWREMNTTLIPGLSGSTSHGSIVEYNNQWYAFYHSSEMSGGVMGKRSIRVDRLSYNDDGSLQPIIPTRLGPTLSYGAYSRIKAMFYNDMSGINTEACGGGDIGNRICQIENNDFIKFDSVDFGFNGATAFEAQVMLTSDSNAGGYIEIRIPDHGTPGILVGTATVPNNTTMSRWFNVSCNIDPNYVPLRDKKTVYLVFRGNSGSLFKLNWFTFKRSTAMPAGYSLLLKSLNPNCYDNNGTGPGQKYLCVDVNYDFDLCVNRNAVSGSWEKFSLMDGNSSLTGSSNIIQFNSSTNGKNLREEGGLYSQLKANGNNYDVPAIQDSFYWLPNADGTLSFKSIYRNRYWCVDTTYGSNPAKVYTNKSSVDGDWEKFYCEVGDAPIGCVAAFKSLNPNCIGNNGGNPGQKYLCIDNNNNGDLCANRDAVGGDWEKFLVVDANNGYIALKSLNGNQYLNFNTLGLVGKAGGGDKIDSDYERFQWRNNGDGTISLKNVGFQKYICVDTSGKPNNPAKVYANRSSAAGDWEKFYCQIVGAPVSSAGTKTLTNADKNMDQNISNEQTYLIQVGSANTLNIPRKLPDSINMTVLMNGTTYNAPAPPSGWGGQYTINRNYVTNGYLTVIIRGAGTFTVSFDWW